MQPSIICASCGDQQYETVIPIPILYEAPGEIKEEFVAIICKMCAMDFENELRRPVIEALINVKISRTKDPEKSYYPGRGNDGPGLEK